MRLIKVKVESVLQLDSFFVCVVKNRPGGVCKIKQKHSSVVLGENGTQLNSTGINKDFNITVNGGKKKKHQKRLRKTLSGALPCGLLSVRNTSSGRKTLPQNSSCPGVWRAHPPLLWLCVYLCVFHVCILAPTSCSCCFH